MDKSEIRALLSAYRPGDPETADPRFQQAKAEAEADPELAPWWAEQQEVDRIFSFKLQSAKVPPDLKKRITAWEKRGSRRSSWNRAAMLAAACIVALAVLFGSWRGPFQPAVSLADYRDEMVSFIRIDPSLDMNTSDLSRISTFLENGGAPSQLKFPEKLEQTQHLLGCRILRFRGHDVALVCFGREQGELIHVFVVDRAAMSDLRERDKVLHYQKVGAWMTASWVEGNQAYLLTVEGDRAKLEKYLTSS